LTENNPERGFSLIELIIAMAITCTVMGFLYSVHEKLTTGTANQKMIIQMQQNLRGGLIILEKEIRMAGYNPEGTHDFKILETGFKNDKNNKRVDINSAVPGTYSSFLTFSSDRDSDGVLDSNETISYSICDLLISKPDGIPDLARNSGGGRQKVARGIEKMGLAFAFDEDLDGNVEFHDSDSDGLMDSEDSIIWAVDSDSDGLLDLDLDINRDGEITGEDDMDRNGVINSHDSRKGFPEGVDSGKIRAVRIWLLARSGRMVKHRVVRGKYVVGNMIIESKKDGYSRLLFSSTIWCRNLR